MPDLDLAPARTLSREATSAPDPVETLAQQSGVSAEALRALPADELSGMQEMEGNVTRAASAVGAGEMTQEQYEALVEARDGVRALVAERAAPTASAEQVATPEQAQRALSAMGIQAPEDARLLIRGNELVFDVNIHLFGDGATQEIARAFEQQIQRDWGQNPATGEPWTYDAPTGNVDNIGETRRYTVRFDVDVDVLNTRAPGSRRIIAEHRNRPSDVDNYVDVVSADRARRLVEQGAALHQNGFRSTQVIGGDSGQWGGYDRGDVSVLDVSSASHEFGHLLGFADRYTLRTEVVDGRAVVRSVPDRGFRGNIMAESPGRGRVTQTMINDLVGSSVLLAGSQRNRSIAVRGPVAERPRTGR